MAKKKKKKLTYKSWLKTKAGSRFDKKMEKKANKAAASAAAQKAYNKYLDSLFTGIHHKEEAKKRTASRRKGKRPSASWGQALASDRARRSK
tara:strand:- start:642 stop:917 length:276 start_codon:yes stop_codon:yes gene_type:complete